jgi:predicted dehydrogenase
MEAVLATIAAGKIPVDRLTTHRFPIERAADAYELITSGREPYLGVVLQYPEAPQRAVRRVELGRTSRARAGDTRISVIGAGNFARLVLLPALARVAGVSWRGICTAKGVTAEHTGRKYDFVFATTDTEEILRDPDTDAVIIAVRHHLHADLAIAALRAGKHVFVEKPLCIQPDELSTVEACVAEMGDRCPVLMVGFNRRFSQGLALLRAHFADVRPLSVSYRFATAELPAATWPHDPEVGGGRIVGEACHAIDTCVALVGSPPVRVFAESVAKLGGIETTDDRVFITLRHADGSVSSISYQAGGDRSGPAERIEVFGGGRTATLSDWNRIETWHQGRRRRASGGKDKGHAAELGAFVRACREGGPWPILWEHIYGTTWASLMAVRSLRTGYPIGIDEPLEAAADEPTETS